MSWLVSYSGANSMVRIDSAANSLSWLRAKMAARNASAAALGDPGGSATSRWSVEFTSRMVRNASHCGPDGACPLITWCKAAYEGIARPSIDLGTGAFGLMSGLSYQTGI